MAHNSSRGGKNKLRYLAELNQILSVSLNFPGTFSPVPTIRIHKSGKNFG